MAKASLKTESNSTFFLQKRALETGHQKESAPTSQDLSEALKSNLDPDKPHPKAPRQLASILLKFQCLSLKAKVSSTLPSGFVNKSSLICLTLHDMCLLKFSYNLRIQPACFGPRPDRATRRAHLTKELRWCSLTR